MTTKSTPYSATEIGDLDSWKRQESAFCIVHLIVLAVLLLVHTLFAAHFGVPSRPLVAVLAGAFLLRVLATDVDSGTHVNANQALDRKYLC